MSRITDHTHSEENYGASGQSGQTFINTMVMPWFTGVPLMSKFPRQGSQIKFGD